MKIALSQIVSGILINILALLILFNGSLTMFRVSKSMDIEVYLNNDLWVRQFAYTLLVFIIGLAVIAGGIAQMKKAREVTV